MGNFLGKNGKKLLLSAGAAVLLYVLFQYVFPVMAPFLAAFLIVYLCNPWLERVRKKTHVRKEILLAGLLLVLLGAVLALIWGIFSWGTVHAAEIGDGVTQAQEQLSGMLQECCRLLEEKFGVDAAQTEKEIWGRLEQFRESVRQDALPEAAKQSWEYLKELAGIGAFLGVGFISSMLLCRDYEEILGKLEGNPLADNVMRFMEKTVSLIGGYVKAQAVILLTISVIAVAGLLIGKVQGAAVLGVLAGILDALPFIGTGIVLVPTALWQLLEGNLLGAVTAVVSYVLCIAARELLEPRLLGKQVGMYPVVMLIAVYAGVRLFGLTGLFLGPLYAVLFREGMEKIWR